MFISVLLIILWYLGVFLDECYSDTIAVPCAAVTSQVPIYIDPSTFQSGQTVNITQPTMICPTCKNAYYYADGVFPALFNGAYFSSGISKVLTPASDNGLALVTQCSNWCACRADGICIQPGSGSPSAAIYPLCLSSGTDCAAYLIPITAGPAPATVVLTDGTMQTVAPIISGTLFAFLPVNSGVTNRITALSCNGCSFPIDCTDDTPAVTSPAVATKSVIQLIFLSKDTNDQTLIVEYEGTMSVSDLIKEAFGHAALTYSDYDLEQMQRFDQGFQEYFDIQRSDEAAQPNGIYKIFLQKKSGAVCFSADAKLRLMNGDTKRMDELELNDWVLAVNSSQAVYSNVDSWYHRVPDESATFISIHLENGKALKLTPKHFIYRSKCQNSGWIVPFDKIAESKPVYADEIRPGDCLYHLAIFKDELVFVEKRVTHISLVEEVGIYAPMTGEGNIVVNDILASCQTLLDMPILQLDFFKMIQRWPVISWLLGVFDNKAQNKVELPLGLKFFLDYLGYILPDAFTFLYLS